MTDQHTEVLYALVNRKVKGLPSAMMYMLAPTAKELWEAITDTAFYGTGYNKETLQKLGWRAVKVRVTELTA
jgi:hypothetical protein